MSISHYSRSGVDIDAGNQAVELMKQAVCSTYGPQVLAGIGSFGGLYAAVALKRMRSPVLVVTRLGWSSVTPESRIPIVTPRPSHVGFAVRNSAAPMSLIGM